jgi:hypothetical protein
MLLWCLWCLWLLLLSLLLLWRLLLSPLLWREPELESEDLWECSSLRELSSPLLP